VFQPGKVITVQTLLLAVCICVIAVFLGYYGGHKRIQWQKDRVQWLASQNDGLYERVDRLEYEKNILQVELDVERAATRALQGDLRGALEDKAAIARELAFYQRVMAPELDANGVAIDSFVVSEATPGNYYFRLILLQLERTQQLVTGTFSVQVVGQEAGQNASYDVLERSGNGEGTFAMNYFALSEGTFRLPSDFVPDRVVVTVRRARSNAVEKSYQWQELLAEDVEVQEAFNSEVLD